MKIRKLLPYALLMGYVLPIIGCGGPKTCTITFDPDNGEATWTITAKQGSLIEEPTDKPEKTAYTFKNWKNKGIAWGFGYNKVQEDMTLIASYKPIEYNVTFNMNGGWYHNYLRKDYTIETKDELPVPNNLACNFDGWYDQNEELFDKYEGHYGDQNLTAHWSFDEENYIKFGTYFQWVLEDTSIKEALEKTVDSNYVGIVTYQGNKYYRKYLSNWGFLL